MSLATPIAIRTLHRKLYRKAKAEPGFRFYLLYNKIYREDMLYHAYALARTNAGAPGVDGKTFAAIEASGLEKWLTGLQTAAKLVLEPIFEADFEDNVYGYRPVRGAVDAVKEVSGGAVHSIKSRLPTWNERVCISQRYRFPLAMR